MHVFHLFFCQSIVQILTMIRESMSGQTLLSVRRHLGHLKTEIEYTFMGRYFLEHTPKKEMLEYHEIEYV